MAKKGNEKSLFVEINSEKWAQWLDTALATSCTPHKFH